jgi:hypothetical protein
MVNFEAVMRKYIFLFSAILTFLYACKQESLAPGTSVKLKEDCYVAVDERRYLEMTEYQVLKNDASLQQMERSGKIMKLKASKKIKLLRKKIDLAEVEYYSRQGKKRTGWMSLRHLH